MRKLITKAPKEQFPVGMEIWYIEEKNGDLYFGVIIKDHGDQILAKVVNQKKGESKEPIEKLVPKNRLKQLKI